MKLYNICTKRQYESNGELKTSWDKVGVLKEIEKDGRKYFLTFHPAAIIYNQELAKIFESDIATLANIIKK